MVHLIEIVLVRQCNTGRITVGEERCWVPQTRLDSVCYTNCSSSVVSSKLVQPVVVRCSNQHVSTSFARCTRCTLHGERLLEPPPPTGPTSASHWTRRSAHPHHHLGVHGVAPARAAQPSQRNQASAAQRTEKRFPGALETKPSLASLGAGGERVEWRCIEIALPHSPFTPNLSSTQHYLLSRCRLLHGETSCSPISAAVFLH